MFVVVYQKLSAILHSNLIFVKMKPSSIVSKRYSLSETLYYL